MWRVLNGETVGPDACPKLFQVYTVRTAQSWDCSIHEFRPLAAKGVASLPRRCPDL